MESPSGRTADRGSLYFEIKSPKKMLLSKTASKSLETSSIVTVYNPLRNPVKFVDPY